MKRKSNAETETERDVPKWKPERQILTASGVDDKDSYKSGGSIELRITGFSEFVRDGKERCSAPMYIRGLPWQIKAQSKEADQSNNQDSQSPSKVLSFLLFCTDDSTNQRWIFQAKHSSRVMAQKEGVKDIFTEEFENIFTGKVPGWGYPDFETCDLLLDPENGFIKDDTVILQAHVQPLPRTAISGALAIHYHRDSAIEIHRKSFSSSTKYQSDFVLIIANEEVHVQKSILATHSEYFKDQFANDERVKRAILQDVNYVEFIELLSVIYPLDYPITGENVETIYKLASKFKMAALLTRCENFLVNNKVGRGKSLLIAQYYGLKHVVREIISQIQYIRDIKKMKSEYDTLSYGTKRMLFDQICSPEPASDLDPEPEGMDITPDRAKEILQELASSAYRPSSGVLIVENNRIPVHKEYLAVYSEFFNAMFYSEFADKNKDEIVLEEVGYNEILELLLVIYPTVSPITDVNVEVILKMADRFNMASILARCKKQLQDSTGIRTARKLWLAQLYNLSDLQTENARKLKKRADVERLKGEPEFGLFDDKTRALILDSITS